MKNFEKEEKLTAVAAKRYDGGMENNGEKKATETSSNNEQKKPQYPEPENSKQEISKKGNQEEAKGKSTVEQNLSSEERVKAEAEAKARQDEQVKMVQRMAQKFEGNEEDKGILATLLDILIRVIIGEKIDEEELGKKIERSEAMRAVRAYMKVRPKNMWKGEDYARVVFMLTPDKSREAIILKNEFEKEVGVKNIEKVYYKKLAEIELSRLEQSNGGSLKNIDKEIIGRKTQAHADLWDEMKDSGEFSKLSSKEKSFLTGLAGKTSAGSGPRENDKGGNKGEEPQDKNQNKASDQRESAEANEGKAGGGKEKEEKELQEGLKKGRKAFEKDFSPEEQQRIKAWVESGDPDCFKEALKLFNKYRGNPKFIKKAAEDYLRNYDEFEVEHSEYAEIFADLMKDELNKLQEGEAKKTGDEKSRERLEKKLNDIFDQNESAEGEEAKNEESVDTSTESDEKEAEKSGEEKKGPLVGGRTRREVEEAIMGIYKNSKELPKIKARLDKMYVELESLNKKMDHLIGINGTLMTAYMKDPESFKKNYDRYQREYAPIRNREIAIQSKIEELTGAERRILGGERDKELYIGAIDNALEERMNRIEYFIKKKNNPNDPSLDPEREDLRGYPSDINDPRIPNPLAPGLSDEERISRELILQKVKEKAFLKKMPRVYEQFEKEGILWKKEGQYFKELQRWAGVIITNVDEGRLNMPVDVYNDFKKIKGIDSDVYKYKTPDEFEKSILDAVKKLKGDKKGESGKYLRFIDYFRHDDPRYNDSYLNTEGKGFTPDGQISPESYGYPNSLEATMLLMAEDREAEGKDARWVTGGEYELIDAEGKFHRKNFLLWMDKMFNVQTDWDPNVKIDFQRGTQFKAGFSYITLNDVLFLPQYTKHQEYEIRGDASGWYGAKAASEERRVNGQKKGAKPFPLEEQSLEEGVKEEALVRIERGELERRWGLAKEHPDMPYKVRVDKMLVNAWKWGVEHNDWCDLNDIKLRWDTDAWVQKNGEIANLNNYTRVGMAFQPMMLPSHKGKEADNYFDEDKQGSYGRAVNTGTLAHRYLAEFTEKYAKKENGKTMEVNDDNMFYKTLGNYGSSIFLQSLAESSFDQVDETLLNGKGARTKIKEAYREFIKGVAKEMIEEDYASLSGEDREKLELLVNNFNKGLDDLKGARIESLKIGLDRFPDLIKLKQDIESRVMKKGIVREEEKRNYDASKIVVREEIERDLARRMRKNIGGFFEDVKSVEIPNVSMIGELKVFTDINGRIVTKEEWEQIPANRRGELSVGKIMDDFVKDFGTSGAKLEDFGKKIREYERAIEEGNEADKVRLEGEIDALDSDCKKKFILYENLGLAMVTKVANISRKELNRFNSTRVRGGTSTADIPMMKTAFRKSLAAMYGLNDIEEESMYNRVFYPLDRLDIAGFNNTSGVPGGIQQASNFSRFMETRAGRMGRFEFAGSKETLTELVALRLPTALERWRVRYPGEAKPEHMLIEVLQGRKGREVLPFWKRRLKDNPMLHYEMAGDEEHADFGDGLDKANKLRDLIVKDKEHDLDKIIYMDAWGVERVSHDKAMEIFDAWWNRTRLTFNHHGIDYDAKIAVDGREVSVMEHFFGKDIRETRDKMTSFYQEYAEKLAGQGKSKEAEAYRRMAEDLKTKPAMAAFLDMVTASIHEHRDFRSTYKQWSTETIGEIWYVMDHFLRGKGAVEWYGPNAKIEDMPSVIPYELFKRLVEVHEGDSMEKFRFWDFFFAFIAGGLEGMRGTWNEFKDELALVQKTPPISG